MNKLRDDALSDLLGAIVLVAVICMGISLIGTHILSQPNPQQIPVLSAEIIQSGNSIQIRHNGGDPVAKSDLKILVDGADLTNMFRMDGGVTWSVWSIGHSLQFTGSGIPRSIQIVYTGASANQLIVSWGESFSSLSGSVTTTITPTPTATLTPVPVADFIGTPVFGSSAPLTVTFMDLSSNTPTFWVWDFGDGSTTNNTARNPVHTYAGEGSYTVSLAAANAFGSNTIIFPRYITVGQNPPVAGFTGTPATGMMPLNVTFTDTSTNIPTSWYWDFGDGDTTNNTVRNPLHTYANYGTYSVTLTAANEYGTSTPYTRTNYIVVSQYPPPIAGFTASPLTGQVSQVFTFTDTTTNNPTSWAWSFGDGGTSTNQNPTHQYTSAGTYTVALNATNAFGFNMVTKTNYITVSLPPPPVADFTATPLTGPATQIFAFADRSINTPTSWVWSFGDGTTLTVRNPGHQYTTAGTYTISLTATNDGGSNTITKTNYITVYPTVTSINPTSSQKNKPVTMTIYGTGFANTASAKLILTGQADITGTLVSYISPTEMSFRFNLPNVKSSGWSVVVTSGGQTGSLSSSFDIT
ncbi:PKD domain-containing protein [Methanoregula sp.]|uniref:type IV pilin N-terminal domain-containing protein n=1 Tax=Methanoregula sp. TaxID=2052170 RepID=UPI0035650D16